MKTEEIGHRKEAIAKALATARRAHSGRDSWDTNNTALSANASHGTSRRLSANYLKTTLGIFQVIRG